MRFTFFQPLAIRRKVWEDKEKGVGREEEEKKKGGRKEVRGEGVVL